MVAKQVLTSAKTEYLFLVDISENFDDLLWAPSRGVNSRDHAAGAGSCHSPDLEAFLFQSMKHPEMSNPPYAAPA
jgi:hypothetical protein